MLELAPKWRATFMEQWPDPLRELALPAVEVPLSVEDRMRLGSATRVFRERFGRGRQEPTQGCLDAVNAAVEDLAGRGAFLRLGSGSFKDAGFLPMPLVTPEDVLDLIMAENQRAAMMLGDSLIGHYDLSLWVMPWRDIEPWFEFRLFVQEGKVAGTSQYAHHQPFPELDTLASASKAALDAFHARLLEALHMKTVVADVFVEQPEPGQMDVTLIELNPAILRTDPCLYSWAGGGDFDGRLRYRGENGVIVM